MRTTEFKDTELGPIPKDWEVKRVGECCQKIGSGATPTGGAAVYLQSGVSLIRSQNVYNGYFKYDGLAHISDEAASELDSVMVCKGDVLLNITGDSVARSTLVPCNVLPARVNQHVAIIRTKADELASEFLQCYLTMPTMQAFMLKVASGQGGSRNALTKGMVSDFQIPFPPLPEQRRIAAALGDVDKLIENLKKRVEKKKNLKRGAMQELLTGKRRLKGFNGAWEEKRLGEIGAFYGGLSGKSSKDFGVGDSRFITFMNVLSNVVIDRRMLGVVSVQPGEKQNLVQKGDLFFNGSSETPEEVAMCAALLEDLPNTYLNSFCCGFRLFDQQQDPLFVSYFFNSEAGREVVKTCAQGLTRYNLSKETFLKQSMRWPKLSEQRAIAAVLSDMDAEIANLESKLKKMTLLKQGMMQDLLTGKVRLV